MKVEGGTYFFTLRVAQKDRINLCHHLSILRRAFRDEMNSNPFEIIDGVILPDHLHLILRLPQGDADFSNRIRRIKSRVSQNTPQSSHRSCSKVAKGERGFWQRRFWEHYIRDDIELGSYRAYCWNNPVKHGLVDMPKDWPHSSFHRAVRRGDVKEGWSLSGYAV
ncbi:MAG: transposase [Pseudomonadota bacterium]